MEKTRNKKKIKDVMKYMREKALKLRNEKRELEELREENITLRAQVKSLEAEIRKPTNRG